MIILIQLKNLSHLDPMKNLVQKVMKRNKKFNRMRRVLNIVKRKKVMTRSQRHHQSLQLLNMTHNLQTHTRKIQPRNHQLIKG